MTDNGYAAMAAQINSALAAANPAPVIEGARVLTVTRGWTVARFDDDPPGALCARHYSWLAKFGEDEAWLRLPQEAFVRMLFKFGQRVSVIRFTAPDDTLMEIDSEPLAAGMNAAIPRWLPMVTASVWAELEPIHQVYLHNLFTKHGVEAPR